MLDKIAKFLITLIIGISMGYAWRIHHEVPLTEQGKQAVMSEAIRAAEEGVPFMICLEDSDKCLRFIPRADSKNKFIVQVKGRDR